MMKSVQIDVRKQLSSNGFPFSDFLNPIIAPLIAQFHGEARVRTYPPETITMMMVSSILSGDDSLASAVIRNNAYLVAQNLVPASTNTAAYSDARTRLKPEVLIQAAQQIAQKINTEIPLSKTWGGFAPFTIDGSTITADDTPDNQEVFPQHGMQKEGVGFPIIRVLLLQSLLTGMVYNADYSAFQGKGTGEMALARSVFPNLPKNTLLLGDRYFPSYFVLAYLIKHGFHGVFQSHAARDVDFRQGEKLGTLDHIVEWIKPQKPNWLSQEEYDAYPEAIKVREVDIYDKIGKSNRFVIVTTLLDNKNFHKRKLANFYKSRWKIELALRDLKDTFGMAHIAAKSPEMIKKVFWATILAYNILRWHILNAATLYGTSIDNVSIKRASTIMTQNSLSILTPKDLPDLFSKLYFQILQVPVGNRPGRSEPRSVKRRPKPFPRLKERRSDWHARRNH